MSTRDGEKLEVANPRRKSSSAQTSPLGVLYMGISSLAFVMMNIFMKLMYHHSDISPFEAVYLRGSFMVVFNLIYGGTLGVDILAIPKKIAPSLWVRTFFGTIGIIMNFIAFDILPLSIANSLFYLYPLITSLGGYILLKERMSKLEIVGLFTSFAGVLCIVTYGPASTGKSGTSEATPVYYYIPPLISSVTATAVYLITRKMGLDVHYLVNPTWFGVVQSITVTPLILIYRTIKGFTMSMHPVCMLYTFMMCIGGWLAQIFMNKSLQIEKAGRVAAVGYIQIPLLFFCDVFFFKENIGWQEVLGSILIIMFSFLTGLLRLLNIYE